MTESPGSAGRLRLGRPVRGMHVGTNFGTPWMEGEGTSNVEER
jgi:hypothetical protein